MEQQTSSQTSLPSAPVPTPAPLLVVPAKKSWKQRFGFWIFPAIVLVLVAWYGGYTKIFAVGSPYAPGATLDPACAPGDPNCTVQILPDQTSNGGKILSTNGSSTTWITETGGAYTGGQISQTGIPGLNGTTVTSTTLQDFITKVFFPAVAPSASLAISGATTRELGSSSSVTFSTVSVTKRTNPVTSVVLAVSGSGASATSNGTTDTGTATNLNMSGSIVTGTGGVGNVGSASGTVQNTGFTRSATTGANTNATFTLTVSDGTNSSSASASVSYLPKVYEFMSTYDYIANPSSEAASAISSDFVTGTTMACGTPPCSALTSSSARTMTFTPAAQYIYYAIPVSFGAIPYTSVSAGFKVGGSANTAWAQSAAISFTNASGYSQNYYIYGFPSSSGTAMDRPLTGSTTIISP